MPVLKQLRVDTVTYDTVGEASVTQVVSTGTKIATVTIDGTSTDLYAPGSGIPSVSSSDNGKVLTVVNGAWTAAEAGGGGGDVIVFYVQSLTANNTLYADSALTMTAMEYYGYDLGAAWAAVSAATAIKIMSGYGTSDEHIAMVTDIEYDRPEDSIDLRYNVGYNGTRYAASIS